MRKLVLPIIILLTLSIILIGCSSNQSNTPSATTTTNKTTAVTTSATTSATAPAQTSAQATTTAALQPQYGGTFIRLSAMAPSGAIGYPPEAYFLAQEDVCPALEGLLYMDCLGKTEPRLATAWEVAQDKKSIKVTLRQGVKYHDGSDFNAESAKWAMDIYKDAKRMPAWNSIEIIDNYTIRVNLKYWENTAIQDLGAAIFISKASFDKNGLDYTKLHPIGTGPFKLESYEQDVALKFVKWENYWDKGLPYLDAVEFNYIADKMVMTAAFRAGQGDAMRMGTLQTVAELRDQGYPVITAMGTKAKQSPNVLLPDSKNPDSPYSKLKVREAVEYAINKDAIIKARGFGFWQPAYQLANIYSTDYAQGLTARKYDPVKAKQLLAEAGYPNGFKSTLIVQPGLQDRDAAVAIQGFLKAVGIDCQVEFPDQGKYTQYNNTGWNNALIMEGIGFTPNFAGSMKNNISQYAVTAVSVQIPDDYAKALDAALQTLEPVPANMQALDRIAYENVLCIPLVYVYEGDPINPKVHDSGLEATAGVLSWTPRYTWKEK